MVTRSFSRSRPGAVAIAAVAFALAGCGTSDFNATVKPPAPINVGVSISNARISASPAHVGAGPLVLVVTNQSDHSQTVTLEATGSGAQGSVRTGPINPQGTGQVRIDAQPGTYRVQASSSAIAPARITVGDERPTAQNDVLEP